MTNDTIEARPDEGRYVGKQVRAYRRLRGMTQQALATRVGVDRTMISRCETGERPIDSRQVIYRLAGALSASLADLTGQADDKVSPATEMFHSAVPAIEGAFMSAGLGDDLADPRPLVELISDARRVPQIRMAGDYTALAAMLPGLIADLYRHAMANSGNNDAEAAWQALTPVAFTTSLTTKSLGYTSLSWIAAQACDVAAKTMNDPIGQAGAEYVQAQTLLSKPGSSRASLAHSAGAADRLQSSLGTESGLQMYGMLHLHAALTTAVLGDDPTAHLDEAAETATRTVPHGDTFALNFGRQNADIWRMSIALEQRDGGRAIEASRLIQPDDIPTEDRRARYWVELGRGYALEQRYEESFAALSRAESTAPQEVRNMTVVRELVGSMLRRARRDLATGNLSRLAERVGAA